MAISAVTTIEAGTTKSEMSGQQRADRDHQDEHADTVRSDVISWVRRLLERLADVVDVVGDAGQDVAARMAVEVRSGSRPSFWSTRWRRR